MNPYKTLGLTSAATEDEVKQAYRKLAMKYHPDRNDGKDEKFKEVKQAYDKIKDGPPAQARNPFGGGFGFDFDIDSVFGEAMKGKYHNHEDFSDILREARFKQQMKVSVTTHIPLKDAVNGGDILMQIAVRGKNETVKVLIPAGLINGESIKYPKLVQDVDVVIKFFIKPDLVWEIDNLNLIKHQPISIWTLITGGPLDVETIDGTVLRLRIPPKTQPGIHMRVGKKGLLSRLNGVTKGDMLVRLDAKIPTDIPEPLLDMIRELSD